MGDHREVPDADPAPHSRVPAPEDIRSPLATILDAQMRLLEDWIRSPDARQVAARILRTRSMPQAPEELIHEAWIRVRRSLAAREEPLAEMTTATHAARYGARILDNLARDWVRVGLRRPELLVASVSTVIDPAAPDAGIDADNRALVTQLIRQVARRAEAGLHCTGCAPEVVAATAIEILQMTLAGVEPDGEGRDWIDRLMYVALDRVAPRNEASEAARAQRKSRCGRCVMELLDAALGDLIGDAP